MELACVSGARLHVVSAYEPVPARVSGAPAGEDFQAPSDFKADAVLQRALDRSATRELEVEQHAPKGDAADALIGVAEDSGRRSDRDRERRHAGPEAASSAASRTSVSHRSPCDVLIVQYGRALAGTGTQASRMSTRSPRKGTPSASSSRRWRSPLASEPSARTMRCQGTSGSWHSDSTVPAKRGAPGRGRRRS